jgi:hypothetical protein
LSKGGFLEHFMQELEYPDYAHFRSALSEARFQEETVHGHDSRARVQKLAKAAGLHHW